MGFTSNGNPLPANIKCTFRSSSKSYAISTCQSAPVAIGESTKPTTSERGAMFVNKMFTGERFYLDPKCCANASLLSDLERDITLFGGAVESFLSKDVTYVVTDKKAAKNDPSRNSPALGSSTACTPLSRGQSLVAKSCVGVTSGSNIMATAKQFGIRVVDISKLMKMVNKEKHKCGYKITDVRLQEQTQAGKLDSNSKSDVKVKQLSRDYIKHEDESRRYRPVFGKISKPPQLNFEPSYSGCPFDVCREQRAGISDQNTQQKLNKIDGVSKSKENNMAELTNSKSALTHQNTFSSQAPALRKKDCNSKRKREKVVKSGYCESCNLNYTDLSKHLQSKVHLDFVSNTKNFARLEDCLNTVPTLSDLVQTLSTPSPTNCDDVDAASLVDSESKPKTCNSVKNNSECVTENGVVKCGSDNCDNASPANNKAADMTNVPVQNGIIDTATAAATEITTVAESSLVNVENTATNDDDSTLSYNGTVVSHDANNTSQKVCDNENDVNDVRLDQVSKYSNITSPVASQTDNINAHVTNALLFLDDNIKRQMTPSPHSILQRPQDDVITSLFERNRRLLLESSNASVTPQFASISTLSTVTDLHSPLDLSARPSAFLPTNSTPDPTADHVTHPFVGLIPKHDTDLCAVNSENHLKPLRLFSEHLKLDAVCNTLNTVAVSDRGDVTQELLPFPNYDDYQLRNHNNHNSESISGRDDVHTCLPERPSAINDVNGLTTLSSCYQSAAILSPTVNRDVSDQQQPVAVIPPVVTSLPSDSACFITQSVLSPSRCNSQDDVTVAGDQAVTNAEQNPMALLESLYMSVLAKQASDDTHADQSQTIAPVEQQLMSDKLPNKDIITPNMCELPPNKEAVESQAVESGSCDVMLSPLIHKADQPLAPFSSCGKERTRSFDIDSILDTPNPNKTFKPTSLCFTEETPSKHVGLDLSVNSLYGFGALLSNDDDIVSLATPNRGGGDSVFRRGDVTNSPTRSQKAAVVANDDAADAVSESSMDDVMQFNRQAVRQAQLDYSDNSERTVISPTENSLSAPVLQEDSRAPSRATSDSQSGQSNTAAATTTTFLASGDEDTSTQVSNSSLKSEHDALCQSATSSNSLSKVFVRTSREKQSMLLKACKRSSLLHAQDRTCDSVISSSAPSGGVKDDSSASELSYCGDARPQSELCDVFRNNCSVSQPEDAGVGITILQKMCYDLSETSNHSSQPPPLTPQTRLDFSNLNFSGDPNSTQTDTSCTAQDDTVFCDVTAASGDGLTAQKNQRRLKTLDSSSSGVKIRHQASAVCHQSTDTSHQRSTRTSRHSTGTTYTSKTSDDTHTDTVNISVVSPAFSVISRDSDDTAAYLYRGDFQQQRVDDLEAVYRSDVRVGNSTDTKQVFKLRREESRDSLTFHLGTPEVPRAKSTNRKEVDRNDMSAMYSDISHDDGESVSSLDNTLVALDNEINVKDSCQPFHRKTKKITIDKRGNLAFEAACAHKTSSAGCCSELYITSVSATDVNRAEPAKAGVDDVRLFARPKSKKSAKKSRKRARRSCDRADANPATALQRSYVKKRPRDDDVITPRDDNVIEPAAKRYLTEDSYGMTQLSDSAHTPSTSDYDVTASGKKRPVRNAAVVAMVAMNEISEGNDAMNTSSAFPNQQHFTPVSSKKSRNSNSISANTQSQSSEHSASTEPHVDQKYTHNSVESSDIVNDVTSLKSAAFTTFTWKASVVSDLKVKLSKVTSTAKADNESWSVVQSPDGKLRLRAQQLSRDHVLSKSDFKQGKRKLLY